MSDNREKILKSLEIPAVPMVAMKILRLIEKPDANVSDLQEIILADQALAARVIRMANSSFYGLNRNIDTISAAILVMGFGTIKNLALAVSTREVYKRFGLLEQKLWEHSIGVSVAAGMLARECRYFKPEEAVMAGLLHDIGKVVMNNNMPELFLTLTQRVYEEQISYNSIETEIFGFGHAEVGGIFAEKWKFPDLLKNAISHHHSCNILDTMKDDGTDEAKLCRVVALADAICLRLGVGYSGPMEDIDLPDMELRKRFGISDARYAEFVEEFKQAFVKEKMLYQ